MTEALGRVLETRGLRKAFGRHVAVADLSLAVERGEVFGFLGPNGAGKTTSLKMLLGLVRPTAGSATVLGRPLGDLEARRKIGFLPEHFRFHDWLTGRQFLHVHGRLYGMRGRPLDARIDALLERVDLHDAAGRTLRTYSKGMLQRVGLAQALLNDPAIVFLDEPTSGLDPLGRLLVRNLIRELKAQGTTVFLNSHLLGEVEATCDRVAFVKRGALVREHRLAAEEGGVHVELILGPAPADVVAGLAQFGHAVSARDGIVSLKVAEESVLPAIARWVVSRGVDLFSLQSRHPSLESVFLEVMGDDQRPG